MVLSALAFTDSSSEMKSFLPKACKISTLRALAFVTVLKSFASLGMFEGHSRAG